MVFYISRSGVPVGASEDIKCCLYITVRCAGRRVRGYKMLFYISRSGVPVGASEDTLSRTGRRHPGDL
jgi:hypothetical protein